MGTFKDHFSGIASAYAASRPVYPPALAALLAAHAPGRALAWDAGCGSGQLSTLLADHFDRVVATDASPQQIAQARPHAGVEYRVAPAEASGLPDASADLCVAAQAAHWFDLDRYYAEVRRVAKPNACVALVTYARTRVGGSAAGAFDRIVETLGPWWPPERGSVDRLYADLTFPFPEVPVTPPAMTAQWSLGQLLGYVDTWSSTQAFVKAKGREPLDELAAALRAAWGEAERTCEVSWPLGIRLGRVSATE